ncbi:MAG: low temperature requirement protein A [Nocardioidaceae bacterium]
MSHHTSHPSGHAPATEEPRVSPHELFFDLVFVFAFTQITATLADDTTWEGLLRGTLVFLALWWCWGAYAWLTNALPPDRRSPRIVVLASMVAMLFVALAVPGAFDDDGHIFAVGWLVAMVLHSVLFALAAEDTPTTRRAIARLAPSNLGGGVILLAASYADGRTQTALWGVAVAVIYAGPYVTGVAGFTVHPGHFAERHGLIVIIALGESVVAIGVGAEDLVLDATTIATGVVAMILISALWWAYFDHEAADTEHALTATTGPERSRLAQDLYSYLHIPLVYGVILAALGLKKTLGHAEEPLDEVAAVALCGGVAAYIAALVVIRLRRHATLGWAPIAAAAAAIACLAIATSADSVVTVGVLAAIALAVAVTV